MLSHIYDAAQVSAAQASFEERLRSGATVTAVSVGYQGGNIKMEVAWHLRLESGQDQKGLKIATGMLSGSESRTRTVQTQSPAK